MGEGGDINGVGTGLGEASDYITDPFAGLENSYKFRVDWRFRYYRGLKVDQRVAVAGEPSGVSEISKDPDVELELILDRLQKVRDEVDSVALNRAEEVAVTEPKTDTEGEGLLSAFTVQLQEHRRLVDQLASRGMPSEEVEKYEVKFDPASGEVDGQDGNRVEKIRGVAVTLLQDLKKAKTEDELFDLAVLNEVWSLDSATVPFSSTTKADYLCLFACLCCVDDGK